MANPNFNVRLSYQHAEDSTPRTRFLNNCIKRISARMMYKFPKPSGKEMNRVTSLEGMRLFFGTEVLGSGDTNTMRILLQELLEFERTAEGLKKSIEDKRLLCVAEVSFLGETETFVIQEFTIVSINADQKSSYVEFEVKVVLGGT